MMELLLLLLLPLAAPDVCRPPPPHPLVATKTPYRLLAPRGLPPPLVVPGREVVAVWGLVRHGTRYPSRPAIVRMGAELEQLRQRILEGRGELCRAHLEELGGWAVEVAEEQAKHLHAEGEKEMEGLGERLQARLPGILGNYTAEEFVLRATDTQRTEASGRFFARGMFGRVVRWQPPVRPQDPVIRSYKLCPRWRATVKKNPESLAEMRRFEGSEVMEAVRREVSEYLGLDPPLNMEELDLLYVTCNFDQAWRAAGGGPWCALFTPHQLQVLEYREDLEYYWVDGPAYPVTPAQSCPLAADLLAALTARTGTFYFSHSGALLKLLALLGLAGEERLTADGFARVGAERRWRTSRIGPFAGNVFFVLLAPVGRGAVGEEEMEVLMFLNEVVTAVPGCGGEGVPCTLAALRRLHGAPCRFEDICRLEEEDPRDGEVPDDRY